MTYRRILQWFLYAIAAGFIIGIFLRNVEPFGTETSLKSGENVSISGIGPKDRVFIEKLNEDLISKIVDDLTYFSIDMAHNYDSAKIRLTFKNDNPEQDVSLGFQDQSIWHYESKFVDINILNSLDWNMVDHYPTLYQRHAYYKSYIDFLENPPKIGGIGTYNIDPNIFSQSVLRDYKPSNKETVIDTPIRGRHVIYMYLKDEPFRLKITKQDLNWYEDADTVSIRIYKGKENVLTGTIADDGIEDKSQKTLPPQEIELKNPGAENPEPGVYKIVIDGTADTVIKKISTNLHKIVFENSIFLVGNKEVYPKIVDTTIPTNLYAETSELKATTYHESAIQEIKVNDKVLKLINVGSEAMISATGSANFFSDNKEKESTQSGMYVTIPKNDVVLNALLGYFSFSKDQYFEPSPYKNLPINSKEDIDKVDYIVANYTPSRKEGDWQVAEAEFDLSTAVTKKGKLSWLIKAPKLKERGGSILIKKIEVQLTKKPIIKLPNFKLPFNL